MGMFDFLGDIANKASTGIKENPNQFAIAADMLGNQIAGPESNPMAGIGQKFGASNIAQEAVRSRETKRAEFMEKIFKMLGGPTEEGMKGVTKFGITPGKEGASDIFDIKLNADTSDPLNRQSATPAADTGSSLLPETDSIFGGDRTNVRPSDKIPF